MDKRSFIKRFGATLGGAFAFKGTVIVNGASFNGLYAVDDEKHTIEGMHYAITPKGVRCLVCPNECDIKEGETGDCRNRVNIKSKLYTTAYGNPCAVHVDPIEKKPLYHFHPNSLSYSIATAGCNLACLNCQNWSISQKSPKETRNFDLIPREVLAEAVKSNCKSVAYTYSEPITFYEYTYHTSQMAREKGIKNVLVSAGFINEKPLRQLCKVIDAANIDLKSFENEVYLKLNNGKLQPVLDGLKIFHEEGVWLEITNLVIPGWTDNMDTIKRMCNWLVSNGLDSCPLHFSRFHPQYKLNQLAPTPVATLSKAREIALDEGIKYVYIGNVPGSDAENTFCPKCNTKVVERKGYKVDIIGIENGKCTHCNEIIDGYWN